MKGPLVKIKKYTDPRIKAQALAGAITKLGEVAARHSVAAVELREQTEATLMQLGALGIEGGAAVELVAAICTPLYTCTRCGRDRLERDMSGEYCLECAVTLRKIEQSKQFS